jgi:hypothetical protein
MSPAESQRPRDPFDERPNGPPDDAPLPPVEPPSAGFIVQLFVVPALIVAAVIGVYLLFGKLASSDVDWRELVVDLRSGNPQTRWRGANGLAQLLEADSLRVRSARAGETPDPPLTSDPELAAELALTLRQELGRAAEPSDGQSLLEYLIKSLGWMDVPEVVVPPLLEAYEVVRDPFLRQQTLIALGMIAGRAQSAGRPLEDPALTELLLEASRTEEGVLRHLAIYDLGFLAGPEVEQRLEALLGDPDDKTRLNAAVGLARRNSTAAASVFESILSDAARQSFDPSVVTTEAEANAYFERTQSAANALTAASLLGDALTPEQRRQFLALIEPLTKVGDNDLRHKAIEARHALQSAD